MFKNETKNSIMAFAVVAMFVLSAFSVVFISTDADSNENVDQHYTVNMLSTGTFEYTPTSNINGTVFTFYSSDKTTAIPATSSTGLKATQTGAGTATAKLTVATPNAGTYGNDYIAVKAYHEESGQTAWQYINFNVYDPFVINNNESAVSITVLDNTASGTQIGTYAISGGKGTNSTDMTVNIQKTAGEGQTSAIAVNKTSGTNFVISTAGALIAGTTYKVTLDASYNVAQAGNASAYSDNATDCVVTITVVANDMTFSPTTGKVIIGQNGSQELSPVTSLTGYTVSDYAISGTTDIDDNTVISIGSTANNKATLAFSTTGLVNDDIDSTGSTTLSPTITQTYTYAGYTYTTNTTFVLTVYKSLAFTTSPVIAQAGNVVYSSSVNGLDILVSTSIKGASKISYNWGDGSETSKDVVGSDSVVTYSMNHEYKNAGTYFITITATNCSGSSQYTTLYSTGSAITMIDDEPNVLKMTSIKATENEDSTLLTAVMEISEGATPAYKWTYSIDEAEAVEVTAAGTPAWITALDGQKLTFNNAHDDIKGKAVKFTCTATVTFEGNEKADTATASYTFNAPASENYLWIVFLVIAVVLFGLAYFGVFDAYLPGFFGYIPAVIFVILTIALFVYGDFNGIIDAITGKK